MVGYKSVLVVNENTPDAEVRWALQSMIDNWDYITTACTWLSNLSFEDLADAGSLPMHKAATAFFENLNQ